MEVREGHVGVDEEALRRELVEQYKAATSPASQAIVLEEFDTSFQLDETGGMLRFIGPIEPARSSCSVTCLRGTASGETENARSGCK